MKIRKIEKVVAGERYSYWLADLGEVAGKRVRQQFATKGAAEAFLSAKRNERALGGVEALSLSDADRAAFASARDRLAPLGWTIEQAVEFVLKYGKVTTEVTIDEACAECVNAKRTAGMSDRYIATLESRFRAFVPAFTGRNVSEVNHSAIEAWVAKQGQSAWTRKGALRDVKTLFAFCVKRGYVNLNPCERLESIKIADAAPVILSVSDCEKLLNAALAVDAGLIPYLALGLFCGLRPAELERLEWSEVSLER